jgi:RHS repeat-associated protein
VTGITYPSSATNSFVYNGEDLRVSKTDSAGTSAQITDGTSPASPVLKDARAVYTPGLSERAGTTSKFYHGDALGSTRGITNSSQTVTDAVLYDAFDMTVSRTGTTATPFGFVGAQGYQSDADSGLQLLGHRYYDPSIGRFLSSDPAQAGTNWYAYTENNPLGGTDPSGLYRIVVHIGSDGTGTIRVIAGPGDYLPRGAQGPTYPGEVLAGPGNASNHVPHPYNPPTQVHRDRIPTSGYGPFPSGSYPVTGIGHQNERPTYGAGAIKLGGIAATRSTWIHGGRDDWDYPTHGCIRTTDEMIIAIHDVMIANPGRGTADVVRDPPPPRTPRRN